MNQAVLMQEIIINITAPEMLNGIMLLRLEWIVKVMIQELESSKITDPDSNEPLVCFYFFILILRNFGKNIRGVT